RSTTTTKRKSSDDPNGGNSKRGKTKTTQEKSSLPDINRFTSPITAFRRKKKTPGSSNDPESFTIRCSTYERNLSTDKVEIACIILNKMNYAYLENNS
ncbi:unnamed protein product, partial [Rotaria sordida]